ncbi:SGNH/GDSL hydrolase family protein [Aetokthonos hydrillicola Thurmond2011]|uniref:SGNH/GDSL hydrolase family protein n=2 Tax=Aetokthonos TaxID=1550243 RepID=A0AAP5MAC7_9CYAN|nr:SGNH/GDSL hydrolase family protein [Aetokthonos hydrillicola]MDR9895429.1 SGNH/GDSL hydrolase family protein [Aetokthonos hydrillicola Thurmond2011]
MPPWAFFSLVTNFILILAVIVLILRQHGLTAFLAKIFPKANDKTEAITRQSTFRHQLTYEQWLDILQQEAKVAAQKNPQNLTILAGDSLSLWFPIELLPTQRNWLNQGISGETSTGLLKRLKLFDVTKPQTIFVMIGINDLIKGASDEIILDNQRQIILYLQRAHPKTQIVIQSILPRAGESAIWKGGEKLLAVSNSRIRQLNRQLQNTAANEGVKYLDLYPLFANQHGELRPELSTDGLHLNAQGYLVWSSALQLYSHLELKN